MPVSYQEAADLKLAFRPRDSDALKAHDIRDLLYNHLGSAGVSNNGQTWNHVRSMQKAADYLGEFQRPVSVTKLWRHLHQDRGDNVGSLPLNVLFETVGDDTEQ